MRFVPDDSRESDFLAELRKPAHALRKLLPIIQRIETLRIIAGRTRLEPDEARHRL